MAYDLNLSLVDSLAWGGHIRTANVRAAFTAVRRHHLLPDTSLADVYGDRAITLKTAEAGGPLPEGRILSSATMPSLLARILEQAAIQPGMRVLQVGTGPGYLAALLAHIVGPAGRVVSVEIDPALSAAAAARLARFGYRPVECVVADGLHGHRPSAPYDRIIATASSIEVPASWLDQLSDDGVVVLPLSLAQHAGTYPMLWFRKDDLGLRGGVVDGLPRVGFLPLYGPGVAHPVVYEQSISELEASGQPQLMREATNPAQYGALWLTLLLEVGAAVAADWDHRTGWDTPGMVGRAIRAWRQLGEPSVADYIFRIRSRDNPLEVHRWSYAKGDQVLLVSIEQRT